MEEYPKAMHGPDGAYAVVNSLDEEQTLGKGWVDGPTFWAAVVAPVESVEAEPVVAPEVAEPEVAEPGAEEAE